MNLSQIDNAGFEKKVLKLSASQLEHAIQQINQSIETYKKAIVNYPSDRLEKHGKPYLKSLTNRLAFAEKRLSEVNNRQA